MVTPSTRWATSGAKAFFNARDRILGVFDSVVENRGGERGGVDAHVGKDVGNFEQVGEVGFAGTAELVVMALSGDFVGAANHPGIFGGAVLAEFFEEFLEARVQLAIARSRWKLSGTLLEDGMF